MKINKPYRLVLIGTDSLRGQEIKNVLNNQKNPLGSLDFFDIDVKEEYSKLTQFRNEARVIYPVSEDALEDADLVFLAADKQTNRKFGLLTEKQRIPAIDLSEAFAEDQKVPVVVSGINDQVALNKDSFLLANPHPAVIALSHILFVLRESFGTEKAIVCVFQPVSAYDKPGIKELAGQSFSVLNSSSLSKKVFKAQVAFNLLSQVKSIDKYGFSEIEKQIKWEVQQVLGEKDFPLSLSLLQVPVFHSYSFMIYVELVKKTRIPLIEEKLKQSLYLKFIPPSLYCPVSSTSVAGKDEIFISQIKQDDSFPNSFWLWAAADNLTRGSALNAYEVAGILLSQ